MGKYLSFLQECDIFDGISVKDMSYIEELCHECHYQNGTEIIKENARGCELFLILKGKVQILVRDIPSSTSATLPANSISEGAPITVLSRGQSFGEMAIIDGGARSASVLAIGKDTVLLSVAKEPLLALCEKNPILGYRLMYNIANDLATKVRVTDMILREVISNKKHG
jgi:CRP/FNR family cyclic AMP-dependent transcriptional regulator